MDLRPLNKICFTISIVCIVIGVVTALWMVWTPGISETSWRLLATVGIVFFGSSAVLSVSKVLTIRDSGDRRDANGP